jgi:DNA helicase-2/ATP-dependent DNA helicase PcrA
MAREYVLEPFRRAADLQIDYANELNKQQFAAVSAPPGPALVLAGAGAGKTRTLIYRVAWLLEHGVAPEAILLLTFTNKAAREMMRRVTDLLGGDMGNLWGGTFHSIGHRILRRHADALGYRRDFTILDREDARDLLKSCIADENLETDEVRFPKADVAGDVLSLAVNMHRPVCEIVSRQYAYLEPVTAQLELLAGKYEERKRAANVMDFDDLLVLWLKLLRDHEPTRELYQRRFQHILVDEYQDTNKIQSDVVDILAARHQNVMVVGDDCQSIYSWRGANFQNIIEFPKRYPNAQIYKIEQNYRSTPEILAVANAAIEPNVYQFDKVLAAIRKQGQKPVLAPCESADQQAAFVAQRLLQLREEGTSLNSMAVLYRSHFHAMELQMELTRRNIPYSITSGIRFFEQAHVKDISAFLKFVVNPRDDTAFRRIVQLLPGIGGKGAAKLWAALCERQQNAGSADETTKGSPHPLATALQGCVSAVQKKSVTAWGEFVTIISQLEEPTLQKNPGDMVQLALEGSYEDYLKATYTNYRSRLEDIQQLAHYAARFDSLQDFLAQLSLLSTADTEEEQAGSQDDERVRLSTVHQAKGLEFDVVFVIMLADGLFPSTRSLDDQNDEEEERRLFYVAITRARNELYLTYPLIRTAGQSGEKLQQPSRFLLEIPRTLLDEWNLRVGNAYY